MNNGKQPGIGHNVLAIPPWHNFVAVFMREEKTYTDHLAKDWCYNAMGMQLPTDDMPHGHGKKLELDFMAQMEHAANHLLKKYQIKIARDGHGGFKVLHPREQAIAARQRAQRRIKREVRRWRNDTTHVNMTMMNAEERKNTADEAARAANARGMAREHIYGKPPDIIKRKKPKPDDHQTA